MGVVAGALALLQDLLARPLGRLFQRHGDAVFGDADPGAARIVLADQELGAQRAGGAPALSTTKGRDSFGPSGATVK